MSIFIRKAISLSLLVTILLSLNTVSAQGRRGGYVKGYTRKNGAYVSGYYRKGSSSTSSKSYSRRYKTRTDNGVRYSPQPNPPQNPTSSSTSSTISEPRVVSDDAGALVAIYNLYPDKRDSWSKTFIGVVTGVSGEYPELYIEVKTKSESQSINISADKLSMWALSYISRLKGKRVQIDARGAGSGAFYYVDNIKILSNSTPSRKKKSKR